jgi:hypothetical protein
MKEYEVICKNGFCVGRYTDRRIAEHARRDKMKSDPKSNPRIWVRDVSEWRDVEVKP